MKQQIRKQHMISFYFGFGVYLMDDFELGLYVKPEEIYF